MGIILLVLIVGGIIWYYDDKKKRILMKLENSLITEETVFKEQSKFEKKLENTFLPDAIRGKEIYIYKNLMRVWFDKLLGNNRYKENILQQLRNDWLDYMTALEDRATYNYLSLETEDAKEAETYREKHIIASKRVIAIEDGFAFLIGEEATNKLTKARTWDSRVIDEYGNLKIISKLK